MKQIFFTQLIFEIFGDEKTHKRNYEVFLYFTKLLSRNYLLQEGVCCCGFTKLFHETLGFFLGNLLAKVYKKFKQFIFKDGVVTFFGIKL